MTTTRALASRLEAWRSFRDIARAAKTLAAAQSLRWSVHVREAADHLAWAQGLAEHIGVATLPDPLKVRLAIGTDLGLCGRLNTAVAEIVEAEHGEAEPDVLLVVGSRLADELGSARPTVILSAPSSFEAVQDLAREVEGLVTVVAPAMGTDLSIILTASTSNDGAPVVETWGEVGAYLPSLGTVRLSLRPPIQDLTTPELARPHVAALSLRARIAHAACVAAASESAARLFTMGRAHDAADRSQSRQALHLRKHQQEAITQDMLEVRAGGRQRQGLS